MPLSPKAVTLKYTSLVLTIIIFLFAVVLVVISAISLNNIFLKLIDVWVIYLLLALGLLIGFGSLICLKALITLETTRNLSAINQNNKIILYVNGVILFLSLCALLAGVITLFINSSSTNIDSVNEYTDFESNKIFPIIESQDQDLWFDLQNTLKCCGYNSTINTNNYLATGNCCADLHYCSCVDDEDFDNCDTEKTICRSKLLDKLSAKISPLAFFGLVVCLLLLISFISNALLIYYFKK